MTYGGNVRAIVGAAVAIVVAASLWPMDAEAGSPAATFIVRFLDDEGDENLNDTPNLCDVIDDVPGPQCTLRAAIEEANHTPGLDYIQFNVGGTSRIKTIRPKTSLPTITEAVVINGYSQPGARENTRGKGTNAVLRVQLDGSLSVGGDNGLMIQASDVVVRGLVISRFADGIVIIGAGSMGNRIEGNFIGTNPAGTRERANNGYGVNILGGLGIIVGGDSRADRNLISGNAFYGVGLNGSHQQVAGNLIGTDRTGAGGLGNGYPGVKAYTALHTIGGPTPAYANVIAFNRAAGVAVVGSGGVYVRRNSIFKNDGGGIDLGEDGRSPNDPGDVDTGPNALQNFPIITSAKTGRRGTTIRGRLESFPGDPYGIQFFSSPPGRRAEGKKFLGQIIVNTDDTTGVARFTFRPAKDVPLRHRITATATDDGGSTSEFSNARRVRSP